MRTIHVLVIALACVVSVQPPHARAQAEAGEPEKPPSAALPTLHGELRLSLADAVAMGIENNLDVAVERYGPFIAEEDLSIAWGAFDPELSAEYGFSDIETPVASELQADPLVRDRTWDGRTGIRGLVPLLGASYEFGYSGEEMKTNRSINVLSPDFTATALAQVSMPLMRNLLWSEPWTMVKRARVGVSSSWENFRRELMDTVRGIEDGYWSLVAAREQLRVAEKSLETARALLEQTQAQYEVGVVSKVEVTEAEAGVADREFSLIRDENLYRSAQDTLIDLVLGPHLTAVSTLEIDPTDSPETITVEDVDVEQALRKALARRPELALAREDLELREIELAFARNQRLPQLDVVGSYGYQGIAGRENLNRVPLSPTDPGVGNLDLPIGSRFWSADDDFFSSSGARQWSLRGLFSIPLGNVKGRHEVAKQELELHRSQTRLRRIEQQIVLQIRDAARNLHSALEGIEAAERGRIASAEQLRAERVRLEHGESTPFDVLLREEDFVEAESQKIRAERVYHGAVTGLERAQGTILSNRNVVVEEAAALR